MIQAFGIALILEKNVVAAVLKLSLNTELPSCGWPYMSKGKMITFCMARDYQNWIAYKACLPDSFLCVLGVLECKMAYYSPRLSRGL